MLDETVRREMRRDADMLRSTNRNGETGMSRVEAFERLFGHLPTLIDALEQAEAERDALTTELEHAEGNVTDARREVGELTDENRQQREQLAKAEVQVAALQRECDRLAAEADANMKVHFADRAERDALKAAIERVRELLDAMTDTPLGPPGTNDLFEVGRYEMADRVRAILPALAVPESTESRPKLITGNGMKRRPSEELTPIYEDPDDAPETPEETDHHA